VVWGPTSAAHRVADRAAFVAEEAPEAGFLGAKPSAAAGLVQLFEKDARPVDEAARRVRVLEEYGVFSTRTGTPLEARNVVRAWKAILDKAGLPTTVRFHDLRHSAATLLIAQGVHPRTVMEILGHSQIATTMNTYGHVLPDTMRDAAARMDSLFDGNLGQASPR
jgi:integrase